MVTLAAVVHDYRQQWEVLSAWLADLPDPAASTPSALPGWTLGDLVGHLGRVHDSVLALTPLELAANDEPLPLSDYLAGYRDTPGRIDELTHAFAARISDDPLRHLDRLADQALERLTQLASGGKTVVQARRGPITLLDFTVSRLIELVVHGYDLAPTLPVPAPVDPTARTIVAQALIEVACHRTGYRIEVVNEEIWIKAATGRITWPAAIAGRAVEPRSISDGTPDLGPALPLL
ncbi:MAG: maleylpyruvate isomerase N-terminal domain-containing protein [Beutenbergiaceae bacterium]